MAAGPWRRLLPAPLAARCLRVAQEIGDAVAAVPPNGYGLNEGAAGHALLFAYLDAAIPGAGWRARAVDELERGIALLADDAPEADLFRGIVGLAWVTEHLGRMLQLPTDEDPNDDVDALLEERTADAWHGELDLVSGLAGVGVYALARAERPAGRRLLARIVDHLEARAERGADGLAWRSAPLLATPEEAARMPRGYFDLGVAHGVPGLIALLAEIHARDVERARVARLLESACRWLLANRLPADAGASFASVAIPEGVAVPARLAWCRGDPGVAIALSNAGRALGDRALEREGHAIMLRSTRRRGDESQVVDANLCHGAAGLGLLYGRMMQMSGDDALLAHAIYWLEEALRMRSPGEGFAGYLRRYGADRWLPARDLLMGAPGVALAFLAAATDIDPAWDALLLVHPLDAG